RGDDGAPMAPGPRLAGSSLARGGRPLSGALALGVGPRPRVDDRRRRPARRRSGADLRARSARLRPPWTAAAPRRLALGPAGPAPRRRRQGPPGRARGRARLRALRPPPTPDRPPARPP